MRTYLMAAAVLLVPSAARAAPCGVTFGGPFSAYSCNSLGTPTGVTGLLGGVHFLDGNTLLIGGNANSASGYIASIGVVRDASNHIVGFNGVASSFASHPISTAG